jgi:hypothetical protein
VTFQILKFWKLKNLVKGHLNSVFSHKNPDLWHGFPVNMFIKTPVTHYKTCRGMRGLQLCLLHLGHLVQGFWRKTRSNRRWSNQIQLPARARVQRAVTRQLAVPRRPDPPGAHLELWVPRTQTKALEPPRPSTVLNRALGEPQCLPHLFPSRLRRRPRRIPASSTASVHVDPIARGELFLGTLAQTRGLSIRVWKVLGTFR